MHISAATVSALLQRGSALTSLLLNGCDGVTDALWPQLNTPPPAASGVSGGALASTPAHALQSLSLVKCSQLRALCLGLRPASGAVAVQRRRNFYHAPPSPVAEVAADSWLEAATPLRGLRALRLGLSGVQVLALALPQLTSLDVSSCAHLR